jgi:DNA-binding NtrC family response regulator
MIRWARSRTGEYTHTPPRQTDPPTGRPAPGGPDPATSVPPEMAAALTRALGTSSEMARLAEEIRRVAARDPEPVLLVGEPGTGKGEVARLIHSLGRRSPARFEAVQCAGLASSEAARTIFGWAGGGTQGRIGETEPGILERAQGGTVFLDPIERLTSEVRHTLVGFLEHGTLHPLGGTADLDIPLDVRVIAATHLDPEEAMGMGSLSPDLHRILGKASIHLPPLRNRTEEDRVMLVHRIARELRREMGHGPLDVASDALACLVEHPWPGNLRQMRNVVERAILTAGDADTLRLSHLPADLRPFPTANRGGPETGNGRGGGFRAESLEDVERRHIEATLRHHDGNRTRAAKDLGIARATLISKIKRYGLDL